MFASVNVYPLETSLKYLTLHKRRTVRDEAAAVWRGKSDDEASNAFFFSPPFWEPREQSYFVCFWIKTAEGPRICVNLLNKCSGFCFPFLLRGKRSVLFLCKETNNLFQIVQITCNRQLNSWLLLLSSFPRPQYPPGNKQGSELDLQ